jgi:hypothetical protein
MNTPTQIFAMNSCRKCEACQSRDLIYKSKLGGEPICRATCRSDRQQPQLICHHAVPLSHPIPCSSSPSDDVTAKPSLVPSGSDPGVYSVVMYDDAVTLYRYARHDSLQRAAYVSYNHAQYRYNNADPLAKCTAQYSRLLCLVP